MEELKEHIGRIESKLEGVLAKLQSTTLENRNLRLKIKELEDRVESQKKNLEENEETNKMVKLADGIQSDSIDSKEIKNRIDGYLKEIDRCIAILNK